MEPETKTNTSDTLNDDQSVSEDFLRWKSEIRDFFADARKELNDVVRSIKAPRDERPSNATVRAPQEPETREQGHADGALDRLEALKRQLTERIEKHQTPMATGDESKNA